MPASKKTRNKATGTNSITGTDLIRELNSSEAVTFPAETRIFREGTRADICYLVTKGRVQILKKTLKGEEVLMAAVKAGEFLGEMAMLSGETRSASAIALTRVEAVTIHRNDFNALLREQHPFAGRLALQLSSLLASRCHRLLRLLARQPDLIPLGGKKAQPINVRVLHRVYTLWAV